MEALLEMGFSELKAKVALKAIGNNNADAAIEWLLAHPEVAEADDKDITVVDDGDSGADTASANRKELTEEEKAAKAAELQQKLNKRRLEKQEEEKREALEKEKRRLNEGKDIAEARRIMADKEMKKMVEERNREKIEDRLARQRVRDQIEADKKARREKMAATVGGVATQAAPANANPTPVAPSSQQSQHTDARLQVRLPDGSQLVQKFGAKESLAAVRTYVQLNRADGSQTPFRMSTMFPRKVFTDEEEECPLDALGLTPSAVLIVLNR